MRCMRDGKPYGVTRREFLIAKGVWISMLKMKAIINATKQALQLDRDCLNYPKRTGYHALAPRASIGQIA